MTTHQLKSSAFAAVVFLIAAPARTQTVGELDTSFGGAGMIRPVLDGGKLEIRGVAVQGDGRIVAAGTFEDASLRSCFGVVRYNRDGSPDTSFGGSGSVTTPIGTQDEANCVAIQRDGKIVVAGASTTNQQFPRFAVVRYNADGSLDTSFNGTGKVTTAVGARRNSATTVAVQSDGKIVVGGRMIGTKQGNFVLVRYNVDGRRDTSFGGCGVVTTVVGDTGCSFAGIEAIVVQGDGKIVAAGPSRLKPEDDYLLDTPFAVLRFGADGKLDKGFGGAGKVTTLITPASCKGSHDDEASAVALQDDGKIVVAGFVNIALDTDPGEKAKNAFALLRYDRDGSLDMGFGHGGSVITTFLVKGGAKATSVAVQKDGRIVVAGSSGRKCTAGFAIARYNSDGSPDLSFNGSGQLMTPGGFAKSIALQSDGKIVVAGPSASGNGSLVARYHADLSATATTAYRWKTFFVGRQRLDGIAVDRAGSVYVAAEQGHTIGRVTPDGKMTIIAAASGSSGIEDGIGRDARLHWPLGLALDGSGNLYVTELRNQTIRKVTPAGMVTLFAGSPSQAGREDGLGCEAHFRFPGAIGLDLHGNLIIGEGGSSIRRITPAGVVSTLAGPAAPGQTWLNSSVATVGQPGGLVVDSRENIYYVWNNHHIIRKLSPDGTITTVAGVNENVSMVDGPRSIVRFGRPLGLAIDAHNNIYVADTNVIRKMSPHGTVTTIGGMSGAVGREDGVGSAARFTNPRGVAVSSTGVVYVTSGPAIIQGTPIP